jgi:hypothetical protein
VKASPVALYGQDFCIIDMHNLFVGTTLEDELLLLGDGERTLPEIRRECAAFGVRLETGRRLSSYSGGEQAIICCLTLMTLLPREPLRILMVHVLETLSPRNRDLLLNRLRTALPHAGLFVLSGGKPQEVPSHA